MSNAKTIREEFLFDLLYNSVLRISEALALNVQDIKKKMSSIISCHSRKKFHLLAGSNSEWWIDLET